MLIEHFHFASYKIYTKRKCSKLRSSTEINSAPTFSVEHSRDVQVLFGNVKREIEVVQRIALVQLGVVEQIGSMAVNERAEGQAVLPRRVEVLHVHVVVRRRLALTPQQQAVAGRQL